MLLMVLGLADFLLAAPPTGLPSTLVVSFNHGVESVPVEMEWIDDFGGLAYGDVDPLSGGYYGLASPAFGTTEGVIFFGYTEDAGETFEWAAYEDGEGDEEIAYFGHLNSDGDGGWLGVNDGDDGFTWSNSEFGPGYAAPADFLNPAVWFSYLSGEAAPWVVAVCLGGLGLFGIKLAARALKRGFSGPVAGNGGRSHGKSAKAKRKFGRRGQRGRVILA